ncbi:MAG TPA: hypothetical protein DCE71_07045 [Parachlamydiales bacterium]|nr:hypothetical protein [Parachlamydiales bacterium]
MPDDQLSLELGEDKDIFVGKNRCALIKIPNGETVKVRDVVVLGEISIQSMDVENTAVKGRLIARNVILPGHSFLKNVALESLRFYQPASCREFKSELQEVLMDWISIQRESADKMNLISMLR